MTLEWKQEKTQPFLKTVSAFAHFGGGEIHFGISGDGKAIGITDQNQACLNIENRINDGISPKPDFSLRIERQTGIIVLSVKQGRYTPYLYKGKAYRRSDTATVEVDQSDLKRLIMDGEHLCFEKFPCKEKSCRSMTLPVNCPKNRGSKGYQQIFCVPWVCSPRKNQQINAGQRTHCEQSPL